MKLRGRIEALFKAWMSSVAAATITGIERLVSPRTVRLVERPDGQSFAVQAGESAGSKVFEVTFGNGSLSDATLAPLLKGSRLEVVLQPRHFMYRSLELPARAVDFLDGIVRAQIDRLTPWNANEAAFGWSKATKVGAERFATTIVATTKKVAAVYIDILKRFHPSSILIYAVGEDGMERVKIFEHKTRGPLDKEHLSRMFLALYSSSRR